MSILKNGLKKERIKRMSARCDPTAKLASNNVQNRDNGDRRTEARHSSILHLILTMCDLAQFEIEGDLTLRDKRSGKVFVSTK